MDNTQYGRLLRQRVVRAAIADGAEIAYEYLKQQVHGIEYSGLRDAYAEAADYFIELRDDNDVDDTDLFEAEEALISGN